MLGVDLILDMKAGDAGALMTTSEMIGIGDGLAELVGIDDQRNVVLVRDPRNAFEGYTLVDATVSYGFERWGSVTLAIANLLDEYYIDYNTDTQQPTNNARFFSGRGRTFTLGWDYRF